MGIRQSYTEKKVIIKNGKVISFTSLDESDSTNNNNNNTKNNFNNNDNKDKTTEKNDTKLPKTGEETNAFARWLTIVISLGIFWLCSMLLIEREKKKMTKR